MRVARRLALAVLSGLVDALVLIVVFVYLVPLALDSVLRSVGSSLAEVLGSDPLDYALALLPLFLGIATAARALSGTIYEPLLRALNALIAFYLLLYFTNGGRLEITGINVGGALVDVSLDVSVPLIIVLLFATLPGIVSPFIEFLEKWALKR